jgi:glycosyltransferase involved in cell wall biosynthesis
MRVGLIIYGSINTVTGGYIYDRKLVDYLRSQGVLVKIFSQTPASFIGLIRNNFSRKLIKEIIEFSPDVLLQDEMNFISLFLLNKKIKNIANFPIISIVHLLYSSSNRSLFKFFIKKIEKIYLKSVNGFIFNSFSTQASVINSIGENINSLVAHPGKNRIKFDTAKDQISLKCSRKELMIIFIGNLIYGKGLHVLLEALSKIDINLWRLSVIGGLHFDLKYAQKILKMINNLKLGNNVKVLGLLDIENLKKELISHHVLAVPSYYESFGMVYSEAMGAGLPVIASKLGGTPEIVVDTINGFLVEPGDIERVRDSISKLIENRDLLVKMSLSSLSAYENMPSWDETMAKVYNFLHGRDHTDGSTSLT